MVKKITIDKDIYDFLQGAYFGGYTDPFEAASSRAYRDFNRTIRFNGISPQIRDNLRSNVTCLLENEIVEMSKTIFSQEDYDNWHFSVCDRIRSIYLDSNIDFYYGQAQKWVNMTIKYLYINGELNFENQFNYLHIPIDNNIYNIAKKELGIPKPVVCWSRWDDYQNQYMDYQLKLRSKIKDLSPLRWEFRSWIQEARNRTST